MAHRLDVEVHIIAPTAAEVEGLSLAASLFPCTGDRGAMGAGAASVSGTSTSEPAPDLLQSQAEPVLVLEAAVSHHWAARDTTAKRKSGDAAFGGIAKVRSNSAPC